MPDFLWQHLDILAPAVFMAAAVVCLLLAIREYRREAHAWFWSKEWQRKERRADEDYRQGRFTECDSLEDVITLLHKATTCKANVRR